MTDRSYTFDATEENDGQFGWWLVAIDDAGRAKYPFFPRPTPEQTAQLRAQWIAKHTVPAPPVPDPAPPAPTAGPVLPKDLGDAMQFYCAATWKDRSPVGAARWNGPVDPSTGQFNAGLYTGAEINAFEDNSNPNFYNEVAKQLAYHVVVESGDKSATTLMAFARTMSQSPGTVYPQRVLDWVKTYDGRWYQADGSVMR